MKLKIYSRRVSSKDCSKYFMRDSRSEIKARMGTPETYQQAQEEAIETEREFACSTLDALSEKEKVEGKPKISKETLKISIVEPQGISFTCWYR